MIRRRLASLGVAAAIAAVIGAGLGSPIDATATPERGLSAGTQPQVQPQRAQQQRAQSPGTITAWSDLGYVGGLPQRVSRAYRFTYVTGNQHGRPARSTGVLWLPLQTAPLGGYRLISFAHGSVGLDDECAPSTSGFVNPSYNVANVQAWLDRGYAVVGSDYAGLGTSGLHAYLGLRALATNVIDAATAAYRANGLLPADRQVSSQWVALGQSEGGFAIIHTAKRAKHRQGRAMDYRGAVATGAPAYVAQTYASAFTPASTGVTDSATLTYSAYAIASLRRFLPRLHVERVLTKAGRRFSEVATTMCVGRLNNYFSDRDTNLGAWFKRPVSSLKQWRKLSQGYAGMPSGKLFRPLFLANGLQDDVAPPENTATYAQRTRLAGNDVTWKTYNSDHRDTMRRYRKDAFAFVAKLWRP